MRRKSVAILVAAAVVSGAGVAVYCREAEPDKTSDAFRERFIREFRRSGLNTTIGDALLLRILVQARQAKRGIEVGSANGFGAINMGVGFERTGGHLWTLEIDPGMARQCRENLAKVGLDKTVTVVEGDALKTLPKLAASGEKFDFVFIDALKRDYLKYFQAIQERLEPGAVVVADNAIRSARAMQDFLDFMEKSPDWEMVVVRASMEKRDGMAICYKVR
jgi:predicted O-methyltransferase YrrM